jgi:hypothetical protein
MNPTVFSQILENPAIQPYLPFFFVLAVIFGLLEIVDIFKRKSVNLIISLVFAFFAAGYEPFVQIFFNYFSLILWSFIVIFFIAFLMEALGLKKSKVKHGEENLPVIIGGVLILLLVTIGIQFFPDFNISFLSKNDTLLLAGLALLAIMFFYAYRYENAVKKEASRITQGG